MPSPLIVLRTLASSITGDRLEQNTMEQMGVDGKMGVMGEKKVAERSRRGGGQYAIRSRSGRSKACSKGHPGRGWSSRRGARRSWWVRVGVRVRVFVRLHPPAAENRRDQSRGINYEGSITREGESSGDGLGGRGNGSLHILA